MSSAHEDKPETSDTPTPLNGPTTLSSVSGPLAAPGEATWGAGQGLNVRYAGRSAVGLVREHNEDNFIIANLTTGEFGAREACLTDIVGEGGLLFAVCDGMGGAAAGEVASQMAVDVLHEAMRRGGVPAERDVLARRLVSAVEEAGRRIFDAAQKERSRRGMGTTATVAVLIDKVLFLAEVGDSRAYLLRSGSLKQLTKDQSLVNQLIEAGHLTEAEAEAFEHSNIILQALGTSESVQVDLTFVELRCGDRLMLCSDGLSGLVHVETLRDALANIDDPAECTAALVKFAEAGGGHDNITVVVIDFHGDALELPRDSDSFGYLQYPLVPSANIHGAFSEEEITEAAKPLGRASYESLPPYEPPHAPGVDSNPWLWITAGLTALLLGAWLLAAGSSFGSVTADEALPAADRTVVPADRTPDAPDQPGQLAQAEGQGQEALAHNKAVPVRVFSDVQDAVLLVNGETHGPLNSGQAQAMDLPPGAYRFEAQAHGNVAAVEVVTVRQDSPVDVYLHLPAANNEPAAVAVPAGAAPASAAAAEEPREAPPAPAAAIAKDKEPQKPAVAAAPHDTAAGTSPAATAESKARPAAIATAVRPREHQPKEPGENNTAAPATPPAAAPEAATGAPPASAPAKKPAGTLPDNPF